MNYRREIDGLRAIAVVPVVLFHVGFEIFGGGYVGVDVFFVISGYLITSILISDIERGRFSITTFYERRARRILPALFVVMLASVAVCWLFMLPRELKDYFQSLAAVSVFSSNILFWLESGYFSVGAELKPLLHTWSLAIEEQYYVLFPLLLALAWPWGRRFVVGMIALTAVLSLIIAEYQTRLDPSTAFYLLPSRAWELLAGSLTAVLLGTLERERTSTGFSAVLIRIRDNRGMQECIGWFAIGLIGYAVFAFVADTPFPGLHALYPVCGTVLIIIFVRPHTSLGRLLCLAPVVGCGLLSYSLYLWHQPLIAFARLSHDGEIPPLLASEIVVCSLLLAYLSWRYVEAPFRDKKRISRKQIFAFSLAGSMVFIGLGVAGHMSNGLETLYLSRLSPHEQDIFQLITRHTRANMYDDMRDDGNCRFWVRTADKAFVQRFEQCASSGDKALVVLGDSHAMNIYNALFESGAEVFLVGVSQGECRPHDDRDYCHYKPFDRFLQAHSSQIERVIYHQSGSYLARDEAGRLDSPSVFEMGEPFEIAGENIRTVMSYLEQMGESVAVTWLGPFTEARVDIHNIRYFYSNPLHINLSSIEVFRSLDESLARLVAANQSSIEYVSAVRLIGMTPEFLRHGDCLTYRDMDHFSRCGERIIGQRLAPALISKQQ